MTEVDLELLSEYQTRSEENGLQYYKTLKEAMKAVEEDQSIWKISFDSAAGERVRLVKPSGFTVFVYEPIV